MVARASPLWLLLLRRRAVPVGLGLIVLSVLGAYFASTASRPVQPPDAAATVTLEANEGSVDGGLTLQGTLRTDRRGGGRLDVSAWFFCSEATQVSVALWTTGRSSTYAPRVEGELTDDDVLDGATVDRASGETVVTGRCSDQSPGQVRFMVDFGPRTVGVPLGRGTHAFGVELHGFSEAEVLPMISYRLLVLPPEGALLEETFDSRERSFSSAEWELEQDIGGLSAFGRYTFPGEVTRALWWDNALLLVLGAFAGFGLEMGVSRIRRRAPLRLPPSAEPHRGGSAGADGNPRDADRASSSAPPPPPSSSAVERTMSTG